MMANEYSMKVKVVTGANRTETAGFMSDGTLKIRLKSKPVQGRANRELIEFLSERLDLDKSSVVITAGVTSRRKAIKITGLSSLEVERRLAGLMKGQEP